MGIRTWTRLSLLSSFREEGRVELSREVLYLLHHRREYNNGLSELILTLAMTLSPVVEGRKVSKALAN